MFEVTTHWRRAAQTRMMGERVRALKAGFNAKFKEVFGHKTAAIDQVYT